MIRTMPRQQLIQDDSQSVHVGRRSDRLAAHLLRTGILRRHRMGSDAGQRLRGRLTRRIQQLGDPEIEELDRALVRHQDIRRLQVAMYDEILVRVLNRRTDVAEEVEPGPDVEATDVAVPVQGFSLHVLHREVRPPVIGLPGGLSNESAVV